MVILKYGTLYSLAKHLILHINTDDWAIYHRLCQAGENLDLPVKDSFVVGKDCWASMGQLLGTR